jgi:hypothetical protein
MNNLKKGLDEEQKKYDIQINEAHDVLKTTHEKKEYTFSVTEKRRLSQLQLMAVFIQDALNDIINLSVLPRIGINPSPEVKILYDINLGRLTVWQVKKEKN